MQIRRQRASFVEADGVQRLCVHTEYEVGGKERQHLVVLETAQMLIPRWKIGMRVHREEWGVPYERLDTWLIEHGYRPLAPSITSA